MDVPHCPTCIFLVARGDELFPVPKMFDLDTQGPQVVNVRLGDPFVQISEIVAELPGNP